MAKQGREFEIAVDQFVKALDPSAKVLFDHKMPDRDVPGTTRQVDVWVNAKFGRHIPITILISCKDYKRKVHVGDIEAFLGEVRSTSATTGVIYSSSGFSKSALEKARVNGTACCRLYRNQPADLPAVLTFSSYLCYPQFRMDILECSDMHAIKTCNDLFDLPVGQGDEPPSVLDVLDDAFREQEKLTVEKYVEKYRDKPPVLQDWAVEHTLSRDSKPAYCLRIRVTGHWKWYRGRVEAHFLNGSYCFTNKEFRGTQTSPWIDTKGSHPGPGWEALQNAPKELYGSNILCILHGANFRDAARSALGSNPILLVGPDGG